MKNVMLIKCWISATAQALFFIMIVSFLMTSCAALNPPHKYVTIHTTQPSEIIHKQDTISTIDNKAHLKAERSFVPLSIVVATDSLAKSIKIRRKNSVMYLSNICFNFGIGLIIERNLPERYTYPSKIFINSTDATSRYYHYGEANNKGELYFHISPSHTLFVNMTPENDRFKNDENILMYGICIGIDYYHSKKQFIHFGFSRNTQFVLNFFGVERSFDSDYIFLSNNHKIRRLSFGYGICFVNNAWEYKSEGWFFTRKEHIKENYKAWGFVFPANFQMPNDFNMGVVFRPTFYRPNVTEHKFSDEYFLKIYCAWKFRMKK